MRIRKFAQGQQPALETRRVLLASSLAEIPLRLLNKRFVVLRIFYTKFDKVVKTWECNSIERVSLCNESLPRSNNSRWIRNVAKYGDN
jgi:hypothetical protein